MELREEIASLICIHENGIGTRELVEAQEGTDHQGEWQSALKTAAHILEIPAIRDALAEQRLNAMSPAKFGEKLLAPDMSNYDTPRKQDRRYKKSDGRIG